MGQGGFLTLVNGTPFPWHRVHSHSYQMESWDNAFPATIAPWQSVRAYVEFQQRFGNDWGDDSAEVDYQVGSGPDTFELQARSSGGYSSASFRLQVQPRNFPTQGIAQGGTFQLGWNHNGSVQFVLAGQQGGYTSTNLPSDWMHQNLALLGSRTLRQICMPGSHDAGMNQVNGTTAFASSANVQTQTCTIGQQLQLGSRYFDIRPVIHAGQYFTGHYSAIVESVAGSSVTTWQGANGQSIDSMISDVNAFTAHNQELVILNLSHDLNTDVGNSAYRSLNAAEWTVLLDKLKGLSHRLVLATAPDDLTTLTLNSFVGSKAAVIVVVDPGDSSQIALLDGVGFFKAAQFPAYNKYANSNDLGTMASDQLNKLKEQRSSPNAGFFVLSWTLTENTAQTIASGVESGATGAATQFMNIFNISTPNNPGPSAGTILDLANQAYPAIFEQLLPCCASNGVYPNVLYMDNLCNSNIAALAMAVNTYAQQVPPGVKLRPAPPGMIR